MKGIHLKTKDEDAHRNLNSIWTRDPTIS